MLRLVVQNNENLRKFISLYFSYCAGRNGVAKFHKPMVWRCPDASVDDDELQICRSRWQLCWHWALLPLSCAGGSATAATTTLVAS